jgi:hypothetical protein
MKPALINYNPLFSIILVDSIYDSSFTMRNNKVNVLVLITLYVL